MRCKFDMVHKRLSVLKNALRASLSVALFSSAMVMGVSTSAMAADPAAPKKPVDIAKGKAAAAAVCAGCHMPDGNSVIAQNPILAGQHAAYIEKQLVNFRLKPGAKAPERNNAIMQGFATMLSEDDMRNLGAFMHRRHRNPPRQSGKNWLQRASAFIARVFRKGFTGLCGMSWPWCFGDSCAVSETCRPASGIHRVYAECIPRRPAQEQQPDDHHRLEDVGRRGGRSLRVRCLTALIA